MYTPQAGIFALGTSSHAYLEFDLLDAKKCKEFASAISAIREPRTTTGGVNFVIGFRPELWRDLVPDDAPPSVEGFNKEVHGKEGFVMPDTQHDALVWLSGSAYDVVFDMARTVIHDLAGQASLGEETSSWSYRHDRDLTGFIDGSENPMLLDAPIAALLPEGIPGAAGSVLLLQKWKHKVAEWEALQIDQQERIMGRTNSTVSNSRTSHRTRMSLVRIRTSLGRSFVATCPTEEASTTMAPCSLDSAQTRSGFPECSIAWRAL
jgi:putative iron-dependent peroxidase